MVGACCLALTACDDIGGPGLGATAPEGLAFAELGRGAVTLVPPDGFCIDPRSLRASFALIARCDTLGGGQGRGQPLAIITATTVPSSAEAASAVGTDQETVLDETRTDALVLARVRGTPPSPDVRDIYWRAVGQIGDQAVGFALYEASGSPELGALAPDLLIQMMDRTQRKSAAPQDNSATTAAKPEPRGLLAGLFR